MYFKINKSLIIPKNTVTFYGSVFIAALQACSYSYAMTPEEAAAKLACEATGAVALKGIEQVSGAGAWIGLGKNVYQVGKDVKSHFSPSKEEQVHAREINKQLELIELRTNLRTCLIKNRTSIKQGSQGLLGIPYQCEEAAFLLGMNGFSDEVDKMVAIANAFNK